MFELYKLIINSILPPGIFIILFIMSFFMSFRKKTQKTSKKLFLVALILFYFTSIEPIKDIFVVPLENKYKALKIEEIKDADCIVVLGGGVNDNAPRGLSEKAGTPSYNALARLTETVRVYYKTELDVFLTGGKVHKDKKAEAEVYKDYIVDLGVLEDQIYFEDKSRTTFQNVKYIKEKLKEKGYKKPILITSALHMKRAVLSFKKYGIEVIPSPCDYLSRRKGYRLRSYVPNADNISFIQKALWERLGYIVYKLKRAK